MPRFNSTKNFLMALLLAEALVSTAVFADKPTRKEGGQHQSTQQQGSKGKSKQVKGDKRDSDGYRSSTTRQDKRRKVKVRQGSYFSDRHRTAIRQYYSEQFRSGHCPPGLARKNKRCLPPGQAKKWRVGYPLPRHVIFYDLPPAMVVQLGPVPYGYRYVRVASDILMIAVGSGLVIDAIQDLGEW